MSNKLLDAGDVVALPLLSSAESSTIRSSMPFIVMIADPFSVMSMDIPRYSCLLPSWDFTSLYLFVIAFNNAAAASLFFDVISRSSTYTATVSWEVNLLIKK